MLNEEDASEFCNKNEEEIINIVSQYDSFLCHMIDYEKDPDEYCGAVATMSVLYMLYGEDEETVDTTIHTDLDDNEINEIMKHPYIDRIWRQVFIASIIESLRSDKLIDVFIKDGVRQYQISEYGKEIAKCLDEELKDSDE